MYQLFLATFNLPAGDSVWPWRREVVGLIKKTFQISALSKDV